MAWMILVLFVLSVVACVALLTITASSDRQRWYWAGTHMVVLMTLLKAAHDIGLYLCSEFGFLLFCPVLEPMTLYLAVLCILYTVLAYVAQKTSHIIAPYRNKKALARLGY